MFDRILNTPPHNQQYPTEALLTYRGSSSKLPLANKNESAHIARSKLTDGKQSASVKNHGQRKAIILRVKHVSWWILCQTLKDSKVKVMFFSKAKIKCMEDHTRSFLWNSLVISYYWNFRLVWIPTNLQNVKLSLKDIGQWYKAWKPSCQHIRH